MVKKNTRNDLLNKKKKFATRDTSYSSFWLYNKERDINSEDFKDKFVNFYNDKDLLSEFNPTVAKNIISFWSEENDLVLDPFSGRTRALVSFAMNRPYKGYEISKDVVKYMKDKFVELKLNNHPKFDVEIFNSDCLNIKEDFEDESVDLVFSCPPYWKLEKYESCEGQLSDIKKYNTFMIELVKRLNIAASKLKTDKYMCMVIGDFRFKKKYYTLHSDLINMLSKNNSLKLHDVIVIQNLPFNSAAFYFGTKKKYKYTAKAHEYLLVWKKQDKKEVNEVTNEFVCSVCGLSKPKYGKGMCAKCYRDAYNKKYYKDNSDKIKQQTKEYYYKGKKDEN